MLEAERNSFYRVLVAATSLLIIQIDLASMMSSFEQFPMPDMKRLTNR